MRQCAVHLTTANEMSFVEKIKQASEATIHRDEQREQGTLVKR
jgi:hypothetical protein